MFIFLAVPDRLFACPKREQIWFGAMHLVFCNSFLRYCEKFGEEKKNLRFNLTLKVRQKASGFKIAIGFSAGQIKCEM